MGKKAVRVGKNDFKFEDKKRYLLPARSVLLLGEAVA